MSEMKDSVLEAYKNGNIVIATHDGLATAKLSEFIKQPIEGLLYDLNRDEATVLAFIDDRKWINDYAVCKVIRALKSRINELEQDAVSDLPIPESMDIPTLQWSATMLLRWVDADISNDSNNAVPFANNIGWGHPSNVVLQQMWKSDTGEEEWRDINVVYDENKMKKK